MKNQNAFLTAILVLTPSITAGASIFSVDNSVRFYRNSTTINNIYLDTKLLTRIADEIKKSGDKISGAIDLQTFSDQKPEIAERYNLREVGEAIGIDLGSPDTGAIVKAVGLNNFKKVIEDRVVNLRVNSALAANVIFKLSGKDLVTANDVDLKKGKLNGRDFIKEANELGNFQEVFELVDFTRRNPQYTEAADVLKAFDDLKEKSRNRYSDEKPDEKMILRAKESKPHNPAIRLAVVESIQSFSKNGLDLRGLEFANIYLPENDKTVSKMAKAFAERLDSTITSKVKFICADKKHEQKIIKSYKFFQEVRRKHGSDPNFKNELIKERNTVRELNFASNLREKFLSNEEDSISSCRPEKGDAFPSRSLHVLAIWTVECSEKLLPQIEKDFNCSGKQKAYGDLANFLESRSSGLTGFQPNGTGAMEKGKAGR